MEKHYSFISGQRRQLLKPLIITFLLASSSNLFAGLKPNLSTDAIAVTEVVTFIQNTPAIEVKGRITATTDKGPLPGVTVSIKGTSIGTVTDADGNYNLRVPNGNAVMVFSFIGFENQEVNLNNRTAVNISLKESAKSLDEVVIVAFGTQKKSDIIGSVTTINPSELKVPSSNLTSALAGRASGVIAYQRSGEPGQDNADFFIRGVTTFGYKRDPLILIDGIEVTTTDLARLQVDDIANFSILKDATATALYGSRAANGVILVATKQGAVGKTRFSLRMENSVSQSTKDVELADPVTYMKLSNEATLTRDPLGALLYSDRKIDNTKVGAGTTTYPANDWRDIMLKDYTMNQRLNMSVSGGGGVARYYVSGSYNKDNGLMKVAQRNNYNTNIDLKSYTLRSNVNIDLTKSTELIVRLSGNFDDYSGPLDGGTDMYRKVMRANPVLFPAFFEPGPEHQHLKHIMFGNYDDGRYINPYADMVKGYKEYSRSLMLAQLELNQKLDFITEGLAFSAMGNTNRRSYFDVRRSANPFWYTLAGFDESSDLFAVNNLNPDGGTEYLGYSQGPTTVSSMFYLQSKLNYGRTFNKHGISGLLVSMVQSQLNANAGDLQRSLPYRNLGVSGRATYDYDKRYHAEFNFGYNGSERFDADNRFGFFPSAGVAWTVTNEKFFEGIKHIVNNLRFRATYGIIGNDAIGGPEDRFFYLSNISLNNGGRGATFGRDPGSQHTLPGVVTSRYANPNITWERAYQQNYAMELGIGKLNLIAEYFTQKRDNILMTRGSIPVEAGFTAPIRANVGEASGRGVDISGDYKHFFNDQLWLTGMGNFTFATNKFEAFEEPKYDEAYRYRVGNSIQQTYGYIAERLFVDDEEAANSPRQSFGEYGGGDIKYTDVNRDGKITQADMVPIGHPTVPEIVYGFGFSSGYKMFDFSAFFQGSARSSFWIDPLATAPFINYRYDGEVGNTLYSNQLLKAYADSHWSEDRRDVYALWPRLSDTPNSNNSQTSTWFMRDGAFLRLKQVEIGYKLPERLQKRIRTSNLRVYVNATNLATFSKFDLWDIEMGGNGLGYPIQKVVNFGLNLNIN